MKYFLGLIAAAAFFGMIGCQQKGPGEKAGERVDEIIENVKQGDAPLKEKGAMEKLGESVDNTVKKLEPK